MSHSQFQSKWFILRRAWLSLWDERMTTGRINQVAFSNLLPWPPNGETGEQQNGVQDLIQQGPKAITKQMGRNHS